MEPSRLRNVIVSIVFFFFFNKRRRKCEQIVDESLKIGDEGWKRNQEKQIKTLQWSQERMKGGESQGDALTKKKEKSKSCWCSCDSVETARFLWGKKEKEKLRSSPEATTQHITNLIHPRKLPAARRADTPGPRLQGEEPRRLKNYSNNIVFISMRPHKGKINQCRVIQAPPSSFNNLSCS